MEILKKPLITEKITVLTDTLNKYGFVVDSRANKLQITTAVEEMFNVQVRDVRTMNIAAKATTRQTKGGMVVGRKSGYKKAIVTLMEGETIDLYKQV